MAVVVPHNELSRRLRDRYEPLALVGCGGQGRVLRAVDHVHGRQVAIKMRRLTSETERHQLLNEAAILLGMTPHPALPVVREDFFVGDEYVLVMDWVDGTSLDRLLVDHGPGGLPFRGVIGWLEQIAEALDHLHRHNPVIVHGDVKPGNIIVTPQERAVLVDFGLSTFHAPAGGDGSVLVAGETMGSRGFSAPEVLAGRAATPASDVFSLAATAFALLHGSPPTLDAHPDWSAISPLAPDRAEASFRAGLASLPARRPATASDFVAMLRPVDGPTNLPAALSSFVGREQILAEVSSLLSETRLLTITGAGGSGKSRLAVEIGHRSRRHFRDGVWWVELGAMNEGGLVSQTVASVLRVRIDGSRPTARLAEAIGSRQMLLILDSCEHLLEPCVALVEALLAACPKLVVLITSREPLEVGAELAWHLPSMCAPPDSADLSAAEVAGNEAVQLFVERARAADSTFVLDDQTAPIVANLCRRLDGMPLAIELAAARVATIGLEILASRLSDRFRLLTTGRRTALPRHQTLRATMDWSYDLLTAEEKVVFARLAVFCGGFTEDAVEAVCGDDHEQPLRQILERLVAKSLVVVEEAAFGRRHGLHETVREYALARLEESGERTKVAARHRRWCLDLADAGQFGVMGADVQRWVATLTDELENIRAALSDALAAGDAESALGISGSLARFWDFIGYLVEGRSWLTQALALPAPDGSVDTERRATALSGSACLAYHQGALEEALLGHAEALELRRAAGHEREMAFSLNNIANTMLEMGDEAQAQARYEESVSLLRRLGDRQNLAIALSNLGRLHARGLDLEVARAYYDESIALGRGAEDVVTVGAALDNLAEVALVQGDLDTAWASFASAARQFHFCADRLDTTIALEGLAQVCVARREHTLALLLLANAAAQRDRIGAPLSADTARARAAVHDRLRVVLGEERYLAISAEGRRLSIGEAMVEALGDSDQLPD